MKNFFLLLALVSLQSNSQTVEWVDTIKYQETNRLIDVVAEKDGNLVLLGAVGASYHRGDPAASRTFLTKYSSNGTIMWHDAGTSGAWKSNICQDALGNTYLALYIDDLGGKTPMISGSTFPVGTYLVKYSAQGGVVWVSQKQEPHTIPEKLVLNADGNLELYSGRSGGIAEHTYDLQGNLLDINLNPLGLYCFYQQGELYKLEENDLVKYNASGNKLWTLPITFNRTQMTIDGWGNCYLAEETALFISKITKIASNGQILWSKNLSQEGRFKLSADQQNVYLAGLYGTESTEGQTFKKLNGKTGEIEWTVHSPGSRELQICAISSADGNICAALNLGQSTEAYLFKLKDNGWVPTITTGVTEQRRDGSLSIFPNPSNSFNLTCKSAGKVVEIRVSDPTGKVVYIRAIDTIDGEVNTSINLSQFSKGMYMLEVTGDKTQTKKLIVD